MDAKIIFAKLKKEALYFCFRNEVTQLYYFVYILLDKNYEGKSKDCVHKDKHK